jgi:PAT family beta-lactamase induction signal transducer AmpG
MGHRKPFILIGLFIQFVCLVAVPFIDLKSGYWVFVALAFLLQMGMALYDTCTDGLALDVIPAHEKGTIQGFMVGGRALGVVVTSAAVGVLAENVSWAAVFWLLAALTLLPLPLVLPVRETPRPAQRSFNWGAFRAFRRKPVIALSAAGFVFFLIIAGANQITNPFFESAFKISLTQAGLLATVWGIGVVAGGLAGGRLMDRLGDARATWAAIGLGVLALLALAATPTVEMTWIFMILFGAAYGMYQSVYYALAMAYTEPGIAASMFAILMAVTNVGQAVGLALSGFLAQNPGYRPAFLILAAFNFLVLPLLPFFLGRKERNLQPK